MALDNGGTFYPETGVYIKFWSV